ncbi:MAG: hypothetical protein AAF542_25470 [Pseudomonadota bacterium]
MGSFALNILAGIIIATVTAIVTVRLSISRFREEKWWEKKVEAYERIIESLHDSQKFSATHLDASYEGREVSEEYDAELRKNSKLANAEILRASDVGGFLLSDEAQDRLQILQKEISSAQDCPNWQEYLEMDYSATSSCLVDIISIAKKDLKVSNGNT